MSLDIDQSFDDIKGKIDSFTTYKAIKNDIDSLSKKVNDNTEEKGEDINRFLGKKQNSPYTKKQKSQFERLLDLFRTSLGNDKEKSASISFIKLMMIEAAINSKSKIAKIVQDEMNKSLGCSEQTTYAPTEVLIPLSSFDFLGVLKKSPTSDGGKVFYEKESTPNMSITPFSLNREFYNATQTTTPIIVTGKQIGRAHV